MGEQFIVNDSAQDMSDGNVHFLNPGRFGVLYNQRVIAKSVSYTHLDVYKRQVLYCMISLYRYLRNLN